MLVARRDDRSLAALLLTQRLEPVGADPLTDGDYWAVVEAEPALEVLLDCHPGAIAERTGVDDQQAARIRALLDGATAVAFKLEQAEQAGMSVVTSVDGDYPDSLRRLGRGAPPLLYAYGELSLLRAPNLGVVGCNDFDAAGAEVAKAAARAAVAHGHGVVSGAAAQGVEQLAVHAALEAGGTAVGVLAGSLQRAVREAGLRRLIGDGRLCLCSPFAPDAGLSSELAMGRNELIYALSAATLVVASDHDTGGTWAGAVEALRQRTTPVLVWTGDGAGPGNEVLVERGGRAVTDVDALFPLPALSAPPAAGEPTAGQLSLQL
ncbi:hypothetical protein BH18ACT4_BH18ACT4_00680 [soil metagenome]